MGRSKTGEVVDGVLSEEESDLSLLLGANADQEKKRFEESHGGVHEHVPQIWHQAQMGDLREETTGGASRNQSQV